MPNAVNFANAYIDHLFNGSHFLRTDFDANEHYFKNPAGIGGADGKDIIFAGSAAEFVAAIAQAPCIVHYDNRLFQFRCTDGQIEESAKHVIPNGTFGLWNGNVPYFHQHKPT